MIDSAFALRDDQAWRHLDAKLRPFVARRVHAADVEDVLQDVYLKIQKGLESLLDEERLGPWAYQVARHAIVDHHRSRRRMPVPCGDSTASSTDVLFIGDTVDAEDEQAVQREVAGYAASFVAQLPSPYREALTLCELEGLSLREAASILGVSLSAMKSRVQRGRHRLRAELQACCAIALDARRRVVACEPRSGRKMPEGCCD